MARPLASLPHSSSIPSPPPLPTPFNQPQVLQLTNFTNTISNTKVFSIPVGGMKINVKKSFCSKTYSLLGNFLITMIRSVFL